MNICINPGTGPVAHAAEAHAEHNMTQFVIDAKGDNFNRYSAGDEEGRFAFNMMKDGHEYEILMPGLPIEKVRYVGDSDQNIWNFPRLYVSGSSWVWKYAINACNWDED